MTSHKATLAALALGLLLVVQPAAAQYGYYYGTPGSYGRRLLSLDDFKAAGVSPLFHTNASPLHSSRRSLLQYGYSYGYGGSYGRRLLSVDSSSSAADGLTLAGQPKRSLLQYGSGYGGYGYYGR